jgi:hypothetical protein
VDFPDPEGPMTTAISPGSTVSETSSTAVTVSSPERKYRDRPAARTGDEACDTCGGSSDQSVRMQLNVAYL